MCTIQIQKHKEEKKIFKKSIEKRDFGPPKYMEFSKRRQKIQKNLAT